MHTILTLQEAITVSKTVRKNGKSIVLAGGCFDILHPGHITYIAEAKKQADVLFVILESDQRITELKGKDRPIHTQEERAVMVSALRFVDFVILLPYFWQNAQYDRLIEHIRPTIIATTEHDPSLQHKYRQAETIGASVVAVTKYIPHKSTSRVLHILSQE